MAVTWFVDKRCLKMGSGKGWVFGKKDWEKLGLKENVRFEKHDGYVKIYEIK